MINIVKWCANVLYYGYYRHWSILKWSCFSINWTTVPTDYFTAALCSVGALNTFIALHSARKGYHVPSVTENMNKVKSYSATILDVNLLSLL